MSKELGIYHPVGSAYIIPQFVQKFIKPNDYDWIVFVEKKNIDEYNTWLHEEGFKPDGESYEGVDKGKFTSWKKAENGKIINFIVTTDSVFFERFILAARVCAAAELVNKKNRILVHKAIIDGTFNDEDPIDSSNDFGYNGIPSDVVPTTGGWYSVSDTTNKTIYF